MESTLKKSGTLTVLETLKAYSSLGIPHFQRGLVWSSDDTARLLESLFSGIPCGSFVFWEPQNKEAEGISLLLESGKETFKYCIIDGQQRIRGIHSALKDLSAESSNEEGQKIWCINLNQLKDDFFWASGQDMPLFTKIGATVWHDRLMEERGGITKIVNLGQITLSKKRLPPFRYYNCIPLAYFLHERLNSAGIFKKSEQDYRAISELILTHFMRLEEGISKDEAVGFINGTLKEQILSILDRSFFYTLKKEQERKNGVLTPLNSRSEILQLYLQINSRGRQVKIEEKAFARLTDIDPNTGDCLKKIFEVVHGHQPTRDEFLKRRREASFGFKNFIRMFTTVCCYHLGYPLTAKNLSLDLINARHVKETLKNSPGKTKQLWDITLRLAKYLAQETGANNGGILRAELCCDDLSFMPETASLQPIISLLVRYPQLMQPAYRTKIASLYLRLLLWPEGKQEEQAQKIIWDPYSCDAEEVIKQIEQILNIGALAEKLRARLEAAESINDHYTLMLYWLLHWHCKDRGHVLKDFCSANIASKRCSNNEHIIQANEDNPPEKQHIIPFSLLKSVLPECKGRGKNLATRIGNLTYITHGFNTYLGGIGAKPINLELEKNSHPANLESHLLHLPDLQRLFKELTSNEAGNPEAFKKKYLEFCQKREELIANGFKCWLEKIETKKSLPKMNPCYPLFLNGEQTIPYAIRDLGYRNELTKALFGLIRQFNLRKLQSPDTLKLSLNGRINKKWQKVMGLELSKTSISIYFNECIGTKKFGELSTRLGLNEQDIKRRTVTINPDDNGVISHIKIIQTALTG
ncbi:MAG: DUF262 domain-containing protein [Candidatus Woesearchaeota archaeon]